FRSSSRALREVRIFSARCFGVYERGSRSLVFATASPPRGARHLRQNFARGEQLAPQDGHSRPKDVPYSSQKTASASLEAPQEEQFTDRAPPQPLPCGSARRFRGRADASRGAHAASPSEACLPRHSALQETVVGNGTTVHVIALLSSNSTPPS